MMDRWSGVLKVPLEPANRIYFRVAVSLCLASSSQSPSVPSANAIFFNGDRVRGTGNPLIERLSDPLKVAAILASKFGPSVNAWVIEASTFYGPFAVYRDFISSMNPLGDPNCYNPTGFPASSSTVLLLSNCLKEAKKIISRGAKDPICNNICGSSSCLPKTYILGFSKGGTVLNQLVMELGFSEVKSNTKEKFTCGEKSEAQEEIQIIPSSKEDLLNSITEIHYIDVGLNSPGAYITDHNVIERICTRLIQGAPGIRFVLHGTPRQWCDSNRSWICDEKDKLVHLLESEAQRSEGKLQVCEKFYFAGMPPNLQMHFEIIEAMDVS